MRRPCSGDGAKTVALRTMRVDPSRRARRLQSSGFKMQGHLLSVLGLLMMALSSFPASAQEVGVDLCACQPTLYRMQLQLDLTCGDQNIGGDETPGVSDTSCLIQDRAPSDNSVPATVQEIQIIELDQNQDVVRARVYDEGYIDGDSVEYVSFIIANPSDINVASLPKFLAVTITARNDDGEPLLNTWTIRFDNDCDVYPVLTDGDRIGWIVFVSSTINVSVRVCFVLHRYF
jgi:hypothetical protein